MPASPNKLHAYTNYTYLFTIFALTKQEYADFSASPKLDFPVKNVMFASAGRHADNLSRGRYWKDDFFIEDVNIKTVIGLSGGSGTNSVIMDFKIVEPSGCSLLERLTRTAAEYGYDGAGYKEMCLVMKIEFKGYNDDGVPVTIPDTTKFIPMSFVKIGMMISEKGTEYQVSAVPYGHKAFNSMTVSLPISATVVAGTVGEYFSTSLDYPSDVTADFRNTVALPTPKYQNVKSLTAIINQFEREKVKQGSQEYADEFYVKFDPEMEEAAILYDANKNPITTTPMDQINQSAAETRRLGIPPTTDYQSTAETARLKRQTEQIVKDSAEVDKVLTFTARTGQKNNFMKLNDELKSRMTAMASEYLQKYGQKIIITSAYRTTEDQIRLRSQGAAAGAKYLVGSVGGSLHLTGNAVDIDSRQAELAESSGLLAKYGLVRPIPVKDPVHITLSKRPLPSLPVGDISPPAEVFNAPTNTEINYAVITQTVNAGTSIVSEINRVLRNSTYLLNQLPDPSVLKNANPGKVEEIQKELESKALYMWKIVPRVELKEFDRKRGVYAKRTTYFVKKYEVNSSSMPLTPSASPQDWQKEYDYIFTGRNVDIEKFDLKFDFMYFISMTPDAYKLATNRRSPTEYEDQSLHVPSDLREGVGRPEVKQVPNDVAKLGSESVERTGKTAHAGDLSNHMLNRNGGDMIVVDLGILGDPDFIKQDDILVTEPALATERINGSIPTDRGEVYIKLRFKTPIDYDDNTGLIKYAQGQAGLEYQNSIFDGFYRITTVENTFSSGKFSQVLKVVRIFNDQEHNPKKT